MEESGGVQYLKRRLISIPKRNTIKDTTSQGEWNVPGLHALANVTEKYMNVHFVNSPVNGCIRRKNTPEQGYDDCILKRNTPKQGHTKSLIGSRRIIITI